MSSSTASRTKALPSSSVPLFTRPQDAPSRGQAQPKAHSPKGSRLPQSPKQWTTAELKRRGEAATVERIPQTLSRSSPHAHQRSQPWSPKPAESPGDYHAASGGGSNDLVTASPGPKPSKSHQTVSLSRPWQLTQDQRRLFTAPPVPPSQRRHRPLSGRRGWKEERLPQHTHRGIALGTPDPVAGGSTSRSMQSLAQGGATTSSVDDDMRSPPALPTIRAASIDEAEGDSASSSSRSSARKDRGDTLASTAAQTPASTAAAVSKQDTLGSTLARARQQRKNPPKTPLHEILQVELSQLSVASASHHRLASSSRPLTGQTAPVSYTRVPHWSDDIVQKVLDDQANEHDAIRERGVKLTEGVVDATLRAPPPEVMDGLEACLDDRVFGVKFHAAVSWVCFRGLDDKAVGILRRTMTKDSGSLRWQAARCLASAGDADTRTIDALVEFMVREDVGHHSDARSLLVSLAQHNPDVVMYATNLLTDDDAKIRTAAVVLLPRIATFIPTDLAHKLVTMMWDDWDSDVRDACFGTLTSTGHTHLVYDSLELRLTSPQDRVRCDALRKIGHLRTYPRRIQAHFLNCFRDTYASVRSCAAKAAACLTAISHSVEVALYDLVAKDENAKARLDGVLALRKLRINTPRHQGLLVWIVRYEGQPALVEAACESVVELGMRANTDLRTAVIWRAVNAESEVIAAITTQCRDAMGWSEDDNIAGEQFEQIQATLARLNSKDSILRDIAASPKDPLGLTALFSGKKQKRKFTSLPKEGQAPLTTASPRRGRHSKSKGKTGKKGASGEGKGGKVPRAFSTTPDAKQKAQQQQPHREPKQQQQQQLNQGKAEASATGTVSSSE